MQAVLQNGFQYQTGIPVAYNPMIYPAYGVNTTPTASMPNYTPMSYPGSYYLMPQVPFVPGAIYPATPIQNQTTAPATVNDSNVPAKQEPVQDTPVDNKVSEAPPKLAQIKPEEEMQQADTKKPEQATPEPAKDQTKPEAPKEEKPQMPMVQQITNEYLMTLENFLNSQDSSIRKQGITKVLEKVKALTNDGQIPDYQVPQGLKNLMNKALQDPDPGVRTLAFGLLNYTDGDQLTIDILNRYMASDSNFGADSVSARTALLKMVEKGKSIQSNVPQAATAS